MPDEELRLPPEEHLTATTTCGHCGASFSTYTWPLEARLAGATKHVVAPVPVRRERCPECGEVSAV